MHAKIKSWYLSNRPRLLICVLILLVFLCISALWKLASATPLGKGDFIGYWSAVYLLHEGENPYDPVGMMEIQQTIIRSGLDFVVMVWNPPTLLIFLLPLAWLPFVAAKATWFVLNVVILLAIILMLARIYLPNDGRVFLGFCLFVILFPQVLVAIIMGQITLLILLGLTGSVLLIKKEQWFWAGASLILTTIKPHMALLAVAYLLLYMSYKRKWRGWLGFLSAAGVCLIPLFWFRPTWMMDFMGIFSIAPVNWAAPTIGGLLSFLHGTDLLRYAVFLFLPLTWYLARKQNTVGVETAVALLTILTVPTTFYGWSYDQSILLIPIAQIFCWLLHPAREKLRLPILIAIMVSILINWIQRIINTGEVFYVWIPLFWAAVYIILFLRNKASVSGRTVMESAA